MTTTEEAAVADLYRTKHKAELVHGRLRVMEPSGGMHGRASLNVAVSLREHERRTRSGRAYGDNVGFLVHLPHRRSFSPDAAYHVGEAPDMKFLEGAPLFAVEVRSEGDYGSAAELEMGQKRIDYFNSGTLVVWDADLLGADVVRKYSADSPTQPAIFRRGEIADAEPAVPGWRMPVDDLFE